MNRNVESVIDDAIALITSLNSSGSDSIPAYNADAMKKCIANINKLYRQNIDDLMILKSSSVSDKIERRELAVSVHGRQSCIDYLKRCCCTYLHERMWRIRHLRWKHGGHVPESITVRFCVQQNLCETELKWLQEYNTLLADFQVSMGDNGVNLLLNMKPSQNLFVKVRAKQNIGSYELSDGTTVTLTENALVSGE
ncbi:unnamed protein product [Thelazia callipaeda]|uniref:DNA replication complex GINS protein PSF1 n=1 Tax=Thelazia callipaeda TaxID=103827 RepID=A0A0N5D049_THECL|nr:unnamed protein product [Thelazia callipaeda]